MANDGGPAYPIRDDANIVELPIKAMDLRDYFAGQALEGFLTNSESMQSLFEVVGTSPETVANNLSTASYITADAMLKARGEG